MVLIATSTTGGGTQGSWTVSGLTADAHTHSVPNHQHNLATTSVLDAAATISYPYIAHSGGGSDLAVYGSGGATQRDIMQGRTATDGSSTTGSASATGVTSAGTWRPLSAKVIICTKN